MGVDEAHAAILHPQEGLNKSTSFSKLGEDDRLRLLAAKLGLVRNGLCKYSESEGGELKAFDRLDENRKSRKRKWKQSSAEQTSSDADDDKDRADTFVDCEQPAASDSSVTEPGIQAENDHEGDVPMEDEQPEASGSAIVEQFAYQTTKDHDEVHEALSPGLNSMDVSTPAQEAANPSAATHQEEDNSPARLQQATDLGLDIFQQAKEWDLAGSKSAKDIIKFQHRISLQPSVAGKIEMCQAFFKRMAQYHTKIARASENQQTSLASTMEWNLPKTAVTAHRHLVDEYVKAEAHVKDTIKDLNERAQALVSKDT